MRSKSKRYSDNRKDPINGLNMQQTVCIAYAAQDIPTNVPGFIGAFIPADKILVKIIAKKSF